MTVPACSACLGQQGCWICSGEGCPRCDHTGTCHLCTAPLLDVVPRQQQDLPLLHLRVGADEQEPTPS